MTDKSLGATRATNSAKCMIRAKWSLVGGFKNELSPTQVELLQVARRLKVVAQTSFALQVPLA